MAAKKKAKRKDSAPDEGAPVASLQLARQKKELSGRFDDLGDRFSSSFEFYFTLSQTLKQLGFPDRYVSAATRDLLKDWLNGDEVPSWRVKK